MAKKSVKAETVMVFGAHSDDFVIGAGGTVAKYVQDKITVISIVFSYGEKSHPWLKEKIVQQIRSQETYEASNFLKCKTIFFNLKEGKFIEEYHSKNIEPELIKIMEKYHPSKLFTHSAEDPHPDHKAINQITLDLWEKLDFQPKPELYVYSVWNPVSFKTSWPAFYVNITKTFGLKLKALKVFRSQRVHVAYPVFLLLFRAIKDGFKIRTLFAEKFYRIK